MKSRAHAIDCAGSRFRFPSNFAGLVASTPTLADMPSTAGGGNSSEPGIITIHPQARDAWGGTAAAGSCRRARPAARQGLSTAVLHAAAADQIRGRAGGETGGARKKLAEREPAYAVPRFPFQSITVNKHLKIRDFRPPLINRVHRYR
jgi:hypothetical protein